MTIKDLSRIVLSSQQQEQDQLGNSNKEMEEFLKRVHQKPFWLWNKTDEHEKRRLSMKGNCCFTHIIGQPLKNGHPQPFWNYQFSVFRALFKDSYINFRPPTEEEREKYNKLFVEVELKSQSKEGSIKKTNELIYPFKAKHVSILKASHYIPLRYH
jgi:hypothetical protein